jgi:hypothetical protein
MNKLLLSVGGLVCVSTFTLAQAQSTVGELLDAGGKALTKDEIDSTVRGGSVAGPTAAGGEGEVEFNTNGSASGWVTNQGRRGSILGTWIVEDSGKICWDVAIKYYESTQVKDCFIFYRLGGKLFVGGGGGGRSGRLLPRTVKK